MTYLRLLGAPRAQVAGVWHEVPTSKPALLLLYLAGRGTWLDRSELAHVVRPEADEATARHNLRLLLHRAQKLPWATGLEVEAKRLRWLVDSDVQEFRDALERRDWGTAIDLPDGEFLQGMGLADMPELRAWMDEEREELRSAWVLAVANHAARLAAEERHAQAAALLEQGLRHDPLNEELLQAYVRSAYLDGQRDKALAAFDAFEQRLAHEMELEPLESTIRLMGAVRAARPLGRELEGFDEDPGVVRFDNLPASPTRFEGREEELARIGEKLSGSTRLLTLIGPGGIGKTRLAIEAAARQAGNFEQGVCLVSLAALSSADHLVSAVAESLGLAFYGRQEPERQLLDYLREKELLLLLDNFESCMEAVDLVVRILEEAPSITILATSRQRLDLQSESLLPVESLPYPPESADGDLREYPSVRLFEEAVRRVDSVSLDQDGDAQTAVAAEVCRLVQGIPLAIELAASWAHVIPASEIPGELRGNVDFLQTSLHDLPERHRSMTAVFDYSWGLLSEEEQRVLQQLSVFRGGCSRAAAGQVAGATLPILRELVNKSFLKRTGTGRYEIHELLRQYLQGRAGDSIDQVRARHSRFFAEFLREQEEALGGASQKESLAAIRADIENVRAAWDWAVESRSFDDLHAAAGGLARYYMMRSEYRPAVEAFAHALERTEGEGRLEGRLRWMLGDFHIRLGNHDTAQELLVRSLRSLGDSERGSSEVGADSAVDRANALRGLGLIARWRGDYDEARGFFGRSLELFRAAGDGRGSALVLRSLAITAKDRGSLGEAGELLEEAVELARKQSDAWLAADALIDMGNVQEAMGDYPRAKELYDESLAIKRNLGHAYGVAACLINLGVMAEKQGEYEEAGRYYRQGYEGFQEIGYQRGIALSLHNQALVLYLADEPAEARRLFLEGLETYRAIRGKAGACACLYGLGLVAWREGDPEQAESRFRESLELAREIGYRLGLAQALIGLGRVDLGRKRYGEARAHFIDALAEAKESQLASVVLEAILGAGRVELVIGSRERSLQLLSLVKDHPAGERSVRDEAARVLEGAGSDVTSPDAPTRGTADSHDASNFDKVPRFDHAGEPGLEEIAQSLLRTTAGK